MPSLIFKKHFYRAVYSALVTFMLLNGRPVAAQRLDFGVNEVSIAVSHRADWRAVIDNIAGSGVHYVRIALRANDGSVPEVVRYANSRGLQTLITIPLGTAAFYPPGIVRRPGNRAYHMAFPLSQIDVAAFMRFWHEHRKQMKDTGATAFAYQVGNEINGPGANGDLPLGAAGAAEDLTQCDLGDACGRLEEGLEKYVQLLRAVHESGDLDAVPLIAAGTASVATPWMRAWVKASQGFYLSADSFIRRIRELGASNYVNAYAIHSYMNVAMLDGGSSVSSVAADFMQPIEMCAQVSGKACWLTEWGVRSRRTDCSQDTDRDAILNQAIKPLEDAYQHGVIAMAFYFDWDENPNLRLVRCGTLTSPAARQLWSAGH